MSVLVFNNTEEGRRQADAVVGPKHEWLDNVRIIVYTGEDYLPYAPAPTEVDAQTYVNQMPDDQLDWVLDMAFGQSPDSDTRRTLFRKFFSSPSVQINLNDAPVAAVQSKIEQAVKGGGILSQQHLKTVTTLFG